MTKFSELDENYKSAYEELTIQPLLKQIDFAYNLEAFGLKMLLLANGSGLFLAATSSQLLKNAYTSNFVIVAVSYFVGLMCAGIIYVYIWGVTSVSARQNHKEISDVFADKKPIEELVMYGLNKNGQKFFGIFSFISLMAFVIGSITGIYSI